MKLVNKGKNTVIVHLHTGLRISLIPGKDHEIGKVTEKLKAGYKVLEPDGIFLEGEDPVESVEAPPPLPISVPKPKPVFKPDEPVIDIEPEDPEEEEEESSVSVDVDLDVDAPKPKPEVKSSRKSDRKAGRRR